jgi:hypothetical protein
MSKSWDDAEIETAALRDNLNIQSQFTGCPDKVIWRRVVTALPVECRNATLNQGKIRRFLMKFARGSLKLEHGFRNGIDTRRFNDGQKFDRRHSF